jgi:hypothetical protein
MRTSLTLAVASVLLAGQSSAGPLDSPLPTLSIGKPAVAFTVSGVVNAAGLATFFSCTNQSAEPMMMTVGLFVDGGGDPCNDEAAAAVTIPPGGTKMMSTQNNVQSSYFDSSPISTPEIFLAIGSARIVTTGKGAVCAVHVSDVYGSPPMSSYALPIAGRGKQK